MTTGDNNSKCKFKIGKDGVAQIYADNPKGTQVYMGNTGDVDDSIFNVSYGKNSHIDYDTKTQGKLNYFVTKGSPINYHSGSESGRSTRIDTYPGKGMWDNDTDYSWKDNPGYLYNKRGIKNGEYTTFIRVHGDLGTHQAYAHKVGGRDEDALRSLAEMVYPTSGKNTVAFNYNFAHFPYVHAKAKTFQDLDEFGEDSGWLALKTVHIVKDDHTHWEMWADFDPITDDGTINNNWEKIAEYRDEGCDEYGNQNVNWACHKEVCRVDGFEKVDFALFSDREILDKQTTTTTTTNLDQGKGGVPDTNQKDSILPPVRPPKQEQTKPVVDDSQNDNSNEDVKAAQEFIKKNPKIAELLSSVKALQPYLSGSESGSKSQSQQQQQQQSPKQAEGADTAGPKKVHNPGVSENKT